MRGLYLKNNDVIVGKAQYLQGIDTVIFRYICLHRVISQIYLQKLLFKDTNPFTLYIPVVN